MGLDLVINPEQAAAREITRLLRFPSASDVEHFAKGRIEFVEIKATQDMSLVGIPLKDMPDKVMKNILIGVVKRGEEIIILMVIMRYMPAMTSILLGNPTMSLTFANESGNILKN